MEMQKQMALRELVNTQDKVSVMQDTLLAEYNNLEDISNFSTFKLDRFSEKFIILSNTCLFSLLYNLTLSIR